MKDEQQIQHTKHCRHTFKYSMLTSAVYTTDDVYATDYIGQINCTYSTDTNDRSVLNLDNLWLLRGVFHVWSMMAWAICGHEI
jgi:hypothetical protein